MHLCHKVLSSEFTQVSYELCEHASIYPDPATVADWDQEWQFLVSSYDNQNDRTYLYTVERTDIATDGSLTLRTQAEVDAFARSGINTVEGNLTIGGEDEENPVTNLDGLKNLVSVRCDLTITAAYTGETLAGLENLTTCESLRNKKLWTSSFVCVVGAYSVWMFALFFYIIDVLVWRKWTLFFTVIGMNSITIYLAQRFIRFSSQTPVKPVSLII